MSSGPDGRLKRHRRGIGLSGRLALQLFLLAVLITAGAAIVSALLVRSELERTLAAELERLDDGVSEELAGMGRALEASMADLETQLLVREPETLDRLLLAGPGTRETAGRLARSARLDRLDLVDSAGFVISSTWEERAGLPSGTELPGGGGTLDEVAPGILESAVARRAGLLLGRQITVGRRTLYLVGGRALGPQFLERVAGPGAAVMFEVDRGTPLISSKAAGLDLRQLRELLDDGAEAHGVVRLAGRDGSTWDARQYRLTGDDRRLLAAIIVAVDRAGMENTLARMRRGFVVLGLSGGLLAAIAGLWIARGITRPVRELVRAFDAAAAGEADYSLPATRQDELQALIASVSRLRRALEIQQRRSLDAERVATWRDVARHVAHEVKNPLAPIRLTVENLLRARARAPERFDTMFREGMATILEEVEQLRRMVEEFSAFARMPAPDRRPEDLERVVESVLDLFASDRRIEIERRYCGGLEGVSLDTDQIARALKNVIGNAIEAAAESGQSPIELQIETQVEEGMACVSVADNGPGFSAESRRRVFEPYFTTRGGGTGLGMALTYRIIIDHGGWITAENRGAGGAVVSLGLPLPGARSSAGPANQVGSG